MALSTVSSYAMLHQKELVDTFLLPLFFANEYSVDEKLSFLNEANSFEDLVNSPEFDLFETVFNLNVEQSLPTLEVPTYILQGRHDKLTNFTVAQQFFDAVAAPSKEFIAFENSSHFAPFEEPEKFNAVLADIAKATLAAPAL